MKKFDVDWLSDPILIETKSSGELINVARIAFIGLALVLSLAGCVSGTSLVLSDDGRVSVEGSDRSSPLYKAMLEVYEACGGTRGEKMTYINWRADPVLPVWTEEKVWHFNDFECISPDESGTAELQSKKTTG